MLNVLSKSMQKNSSISVFFWHLPLLKFQNQVTLLHTSTFYSRVTKVVADHGFEFSGLYARPKTYENGHKNIFGLSVVLELKVENSKILTF